MLTVNAVDTGVEQKWLPEENRTMVNEIRCWLHFI